MYEYLSQQSQSMTNNHREPNFQRLRTALLRQGEPDLLPFGELKYGHEIMEALLGRKIPQGGVGHLIRPKGN